MKKIFMFLNQENPQRTRKVPKKYRTKNGSKK